MLPDIKEAKTKLGDSDQHSIAVFTRKILSEEPYFVQHCRWPEKKIGKDKVPKACHHTMVLSGDLRMVET